MRIVTPRLTLESISPALASRIVLRKELPGDCWHSEYPLEDELDPLRSLAAGAAGHPIFTMYLVRRKLGGLAVGGLGFFGPPDAEGRIEFGYGLVPAARGFGLATEAVQGALATAFAHGALLAIADTAEVNLASQRVLVRAGLSESRREDGTVFFFRELTAER